MTNLALTPSDTFGLGILGVLGAFLSILWLAPYVDQGLQWVRRRLGRNAL